MWDRATRQQLKTGSFSTPKNLQRIVEGEFCNRAIGRCLDINYTTALLWPSVAVLNEPNQSARPGSLTERLEGLSYSAVSVSLPRISAQAFYPAVSHFPTKMPLPAEGFSFHPRTFYSLYSLLILIANGEELYFDVYHMTRLTHNH